MAKWVSKSDLVDQVITEIQSTEGVQDGDLKRLLIGRNLTPGDKDVRMEIFLLAYDLCGQNLAEVERKTGISRKSGKVLLMRHAKTLQLDPELQKQKVDHLLKLEDLRYQGKKSLIELFNEGAERAIRVALSKVDDMKAIEAFKAAAISTDKLLLLTGQPTSRIARTDARMMSEDELRQRLSEFDRMREKGVIPIQVPNGSQAH